MKMRLSAFAHVDISFPHFISFICALFRVSFAHFDISFPHLILFIFALFRVSFAHENDYLVLFLFRIGLMVVLHEFTEHVLEINPLSFNAFA